MPSIAFCRLQLKMQLKLAQNAFLPTSLWLARFRLCVSGSIVSSRSTLDMSRTLYLTICILHCTAPVAVVLYAKCKSACQLPTVLVFQALTVLVEALLNNTLLLHLHFTLMVSHHLNFSCKQKSSCLANSKVLSCALPHPDVPSYQYRPGFSGIALSHPNSS